jgi:hypothetical protein
VKSSVVIGGSVGVEVRVGLAVGLGVGVFVGLFVSVGAGETVAEGRVVGVSVGSCREEKAVVALGVGVTDGLGWQAVARQRMIISSMARKTGGMMKVQGLSLKTGGTDPIQERKRGEWHENDQSSTGGAAGP